VQREFKGTGMNSTSAGHRWAFYEVVDFEIGKGENNAKDED